MASIAKDCNVDQILTGELEWFGCRMQLTHVKGRILRALAAHGAVAQDGPDSFSPNMVSKTLARDESDAAMASE